MDSYIPISCHHCEKEDMSTSNEVEEKHVKDAVLEWNSFVLGEET